MIAVISNSAGQAFARVEVPETLAARQAGLLKYENLPEGTGMFFPQASSIHTMGMHFPIDVVFLNAEDRILDLVECLPPGCPHLLLPRSAAVLELPAGTIKRVGLRIGEKLQIVRCRGRGR